MGFKSRKTKLMVMARNEATETCQIIVGYGTIYPSGSIGLDGATERKAQEEKAMLEDAKQIHDILMQHLPQQTFNNLRELFKHKIS